MSHTSPQKLTISRKLKLRAAASCMALSLCGAAHAATTYEYSPTDQPNLAQIGVDKTWHNEGREAARAGSA